MPSITPYFPDSALKASAVKSEVDVLDIEEGFCFPACDPKVPYFLTDETKTTTLQTNTHLPLVQTLTTLSLPLGFPETEVEMAAVDFLPVDQYNIKCILDPVSQGKVGEEADEFSSPEKKIIGERFEEILKPRCELGHKLPQKSQELVRNPKLLSRKSNTTESEGDLKNGVVGGVVANLLQFLIKRKFESCSQLSVVIGGNSLQLLTGYSTGFRVHIEDFVFEGCAVTEAEAHTLLKPGKEIHFNLKSARTGGKLFSKKVLTKMSMRFKESDSTFSLRKNGNLLLRETMEHFWKSRISQDGSNRKCETLSQMPALKVKYENGFALFEEILEDYAHHLHTPVKMALKYTIEVLGNKSHLLVREVEVGDYTFPRENGAYKPAEKIVDLPPDIHFLTFSVDNGLMDFSYAFELDL